MDFGAQAEGISREPFSQLGRAARRGRTGARHDGKAQAMSRATPGGEPCAPDTSKCEMTPPKVDVRQTDKHATFAGPDSRLTQFDLTQSCHNKETNDTCDFSVTLDSWLTQDEIAGVADVTAFRAAYLKKLGLDDPNSQMLKQVRQFLAPYRDS